MKRNLFAISTLVAAMAVGTAWAGDPAATTPQPSKASQATLETTALDLNTREPEAEPTETAPGTQPSTGPALELELDLDLDLEMDPACSPSPQCFRDRDCWGICGKNNGTCRRVNSCYSECICNVA
jgi:hypothetical protein